MNPSVQRLEALLQRIEARRRADRSQPAASLEPAARVVRPVPRTATPVLDTLAALDSSAKRPDVATTLGVHEDSAQMLIIEEPAAEAAPRVDAPRPTALSAEPVAIALMAISGAPVARTVAQAPVVRALSLGALFARALALRAR